MNEISSRNPELFESRMITAPLFGLLALAWAIFIQSALHQRDLSWFPILFGSRIFLLVLAIALAAVSVIRPIRNLLPIYLTLCIPFQAMFGILEGPSQVEYYQYVSYFILLGALSFNGPFLSWLKTFGVAGAIGLVIPLFFKSLSYFESIGTFAYTFTTPVVMTFLSIMIVRVASAKYKALQSNLKLKEQLLAVTRAAKEELALELEKAKIKIEEDAKKMVFADIAHDVSHNIRSPLAALELKMTEVTVTPAHKATEIRDIIQRMRDIANQLIQTGNQKRQAISQGKNEHTADQLNQSRKRELFSDELLPMLIDSTVSEKRIEYRPKLDLRIDYALTPESYGLFVKIQPTDFRCVLSNLINNAVEACTDDGRIEIVVRPGRENGVVEIAVLDNGIGVPQVVLEKLGERGLSIGKPGGSGLGLAHAKEAVERWGGRLILLPRANGGTEARIILPRVPAPAWFARELQLSEGQQLVVIDDDFSVHQLWQSRLAGEKLVHLNGPDDLDSWMRDNSTDMGFFLVDYEFLGHGQNGVDVVKAHDLADRSVLVTSHFDKAELRVECETISLRIVPKGMAAQVPVVSG